MKNRKITPHSRLKTILTSAATFSILSLLPKLLVMAKDAAVAFYFGTGQALDIYLMAFVLIGMPISIIVISLHTTLVPAMAGANTEIMASLLGGALKFVLGVLLIALPLWLYLIPHAFTMLYPGGSETSRSSLQNACYWLIPYYILNGINIILDGALQARKIFWPNAILSGFFPLSILVAVGLMQSADIRVLLIGTIVGSLFQCVALYIMVLRRCGINWRRTNGYVLRPVLRSSLPLVIGAILSSFAPLIEQVISFRLGPGSVALLNYGNKVPTAVNTFLVTAIGIVLLPHYADFIAARKWRECESLYLRISGIVMAVGATVSTIGIVFAEDIIRLLFERGAFTAIDTQYASDVMRAYILQLPFLLAAMVSSRILAAMGKTIAMTAITAVQMLLASSLAYLFSLYFGVAGVAMGTASGALFAAGLFAWAARLGLKKQLTGMPL